MKVSGIIPLRNAVKLGYPYELAIRSMADFCDEVIVLADPTSEDSTAEQADRLLCELNEFWAAPDLCRAVHSAWDMTNHDGLNDEIAKQTAIAMQHATGDWVMSLQADEVLHEGEVSAIREAITKAEQEGVTALELTRWYFFGSLALYRDNWTVPLPRLVKRGCWRPDPASGAMYFVPVGEQRKAKINAGIFHYSRVGDPLAIAKRVRNLDLFYHAPDRVAAEQDVKPYTFEARKLDTYVVGHEAEADAEAKLVPFPIDRHPKAARDFYGVK